MVSHERNTAPTVTGGLAISLVATVARNSSRDESKCHFEWRFNLRLDERLLPNYVRDIDVDSDARIVLEKKKMRDRHLTPGSSSKSLIRGSQRFDIKDIEECYVRLIN